MAYAAGTFDIIIIGAGHAGIEAALVSARLGCSVLCVTTHLDAVGNLPCNPSIGGTAKGQLVRELDALGGEMGRAADATGIQFRMLNRGKGPAVYSPRCQSDRMAYRAYMRAALEAEARLRLTQDECVNFLIEDDRIAGVELSGGGRYAARAVVLATGTFLRAKTFIGEAVRRSGPDGLMSADGLSPKLAALGLRLRRFKTGTPPRIDTSTVDYSGMEPQRGDAEPQGFSFSNRFVPQNKIECHLTYTSPEAHAAILGGLDRSPLYGGAIEGTGPRYCPSIEDKLVRFPDKARHQIFLEPCGEHTREVYLQGLSTSLPEDVQLGFIRAIPGLEGAHIMRPGYAIEYDCLDPLQLDSTLMVRHIPGLFAAGQVCGSSGYEEAAVQGFVAGVNAAHRVLGREALILQRDNGYIGTLIDDLTTRGTEEPYRMMTSRCEHRLLCRQDNADRRLMPLGHALGLVSDARLAHMEAEYQAAEAEVRRLDTVIAPPSTAVNALLEGCGTAPLSGRGASLQALLRRPEVGYEALEPLDPGRPTHSKKVIEQVEIAVKYQGYIERQQAAVLDARRMEGRVLPERIDYLSLHVLRTEARIKLDAQRPRTLGQASRISGVSPADINALIVYLSSRGTLDGKE